MPSFLRLSCGCTVPAGMGPQWGGAACPKHGVVPVAASLGEEPRALSPEDVSWAARYSCGCTHARDDRSGLPDTCPAHGGVFLECKLIPWYVGLDVMTRQVETGRVFDYSCGCHRRLEVFQQTPPAHCGQCPRNGRLLPR